MTKFILLVSLSLMAFNAQAVEWVNGQLTFDDAQDQKAFESCMDQMWSEQKQLASMDALDINFEKALAHAGKTYAELQTSKDKLELHKAILAMHHKVTRSVLAYEEEIAQTDFVDIIMATAKMDVPPPGETAKYSLESLQALASELYIWVHVVDARDQILKAKFRDPTETVTGLQQVCGSAIEFDRLTRMSKTKQP